MSRDSTPLENYIDNDADLHLSFSRYVNWLRSLVDRAAVRLAKEKAEWHDDPEAADHASYHAPADEQFPRAERDQVILDMVRMQLGERAMQERITELRKHNTNHKENK